MNEKKLYSLCFPVVSVLSGIFWIIVFWLTAGKIFFNNEVISAIPVICGGIVSAFLAVNFQIDTSRCFKVRMIFFVVSLLTFTIPALMVYSWGIGYVFYYMIASSCIALLAEIICFVKLHIKIKDFAVIMLSDVLAGDLVMLVIILFIATNNI